MPCQITSTLPWTVEVKSSTAPTPRSSPLLMIATRSHSASASDRMWVEKNTVLPSCLSCSIRSRTSRRPRGSSPDMGSSKKTSFGLCRMACAIPARCSMPLENLRNCTPFTSVRPTRCSTSSIAALAVFAGHAGELSVIVKQFVRSEIVVEVRLLGKKSDLRFDFWIGPLATENASRSRGRKHQAHQHFQSRRLARAIGPEEAENLALFHRSSGVAAARVWAACARTPPCRSFRGREFQLQPWRVSEQSASHRSQIFPKKIISKTMPRKNPCACYVGHCRGRMHDPGRRALGESPKIFEGPQISQS